MIDEDKLLEMVNIKNHNITKSILEGYLKDININSISNDIKNQYRLELWDKKSDINGIKAKDIIKSRPYEIGYVYLIYVNDKLIYLQDFDPTKNGYNKMSKEDALKIGNDFVEKKIDEILLNKIYDIILLKNK